MRVKHIEKLNCKLRKSTRKATQTEPRKWNLAVKGRCCKLPRKQWLKIKHLLTTNLVSKNDDGFNGGNIIVLFRVHQPAHGLRSVYSTDFSLGNSSPSNFKLRK